MTEKATSTSNDNVQPRDVFQLEKEHKAEIRRLPYADRAELGEKARVEFREILAQAEKPDGDKNDDSQYNFDLVEGKSKGEARAEAFRLQALMSYCAEVNQRELEDEKLRKAQSMEIPGALDYAIERDREFNLGDSGLVQHFQKVHGLPKNIDYRSAHTRVMPHASIRDVMNVISTGGGAGSGITVNRPRLGLPVLMAVSKRDYLTPLLPRLSCPEGTDTYKFLKEAENPVASVVAGVAEGAEIPEQNTGATDVSVTMIKRAVLSTMTNEQATDVPQAEEFVNNYLTRSVMEDMENQTLNGNGTGDNANGLIAQKGLTKAKTNTSTLLDFYVEALGDFWAVRGTGAGKKPSHLVISFPELTRIMQQKDDDGRYLWAEARMGEYRMLWGIPIALSDYMPANTGMLINVEDVAIVIKSGVEMDYGVTSDDFKRYRTSVRFVHRFNVLVQRNNSIQTLTALNVAKA